MKPSLELQLHETIWVTKKVTIPAKTQSPVTVVTSCYVIMAIEHLQTDKSTKRELPQRGIQNVRQYVPFWIPVTNFSKALVTLPKNMLITVGVDLPGSIMAYEEPVLSSKTEANPAYYKKSGEWWRPTKLHQWLKRRMKRGKCTTDDNIFRSTPNLFDIAMNSGKWLKSSRQLWHGHLGRISITNHRIKLTSGHKSPRTGPVANRATSKRILKSVIEKCYKWGWLSRPKQNEQPQLCLRRRKMAYLDSVEN